MARLPQVGEFETVLEVGATLLQMREARPFRRDIILSMALAHCGLASADFDDQAVAAGCVHIRALTPLLEDIGYALYPAQHTSVLKQNLGTSRL